MLADEVAPHLLEIGIGRAAGHLAHEVAHTFGQRRSRQHRVDRHARARDRLRKAARHRDLRRLCHAVMDHLGRDVQAGLGRDEHHASPPARHHLGRVVPRQPDARQHVRLEESHPVLVRNLEERLRLEDAGVVDQDVGVGHGTDDIAGAFRGGEIARRRDEASARHFGLELRDCRVHARLRTSVDRDGCAHGRQLARRRIADTARRPSHHRATIFQIQIHGLSL